MNRQRQFVIGDIHGCARTFKSLLHDKINLSKSDMVYLLGDYIDRGPASKDVIDHILFLKNEGYSIFPIMGNHERMLLDALQDRSKLGIWIKNKGMETISSFGITDLMELNQKYIDFIKELPYFAELENFILVHGFLNFTDGNLFEDYEAMLWSRPGAVDLVKTKGKRVIVGHTPLPLKFIQASVFSDCITLDGGCVYSDREYLGYLVALELNSMELIYQYNMDF